MRLLTVRWLVPVPVLAVLAGSHGTAAQQSSSPGERLIPARLVERTVLPQYPPAARAIGLEGDVAFQARIDEHGLVAGVSVLEVPAADVGFEDAVRTAVAQWRFEPARLGDRAVASTHVERLTFTLDPSRTWPGSRVYAKSSAEVWRTVREQVRALGLTVEALDTRAQVVHTRRVDFGAPPRRPARPELTGPYRAEGFQLWMFVPPGIEPGRVHVRAALDLSNARRWLASRGQGVYDGRIDDASDVTDWFLQRLGDALGAQGEPLRSDIRARAAQLRRIAGDASPCAQRLAEYVPSEDRRPEPPGLLRQQPPAYPAGDLEAKRVGEVWLDVLLLEDGSPQDVRRTPGRTEVPGQLEAAGRQAARRWAFSPARLDGCPVPFQATIATNFVLR